MGITGWRLRVGDSARGCGMFGRHWGMSEEGMAAWGMSRTHWALGNVVLAWGHVRHVCGHVLRHWGCSSGLLGVIDALAASSCICVRQGGTGTVGVHWGMRRCGGQWRATSVV